MVRQDAAPVKSKIDDFGVTSDCLSGRAGLSLVSRYLDGIGITRMLTLWFPSLKKNGKGTPLRSLFHQIICFFFDGTDFHMTRFDQLKKDSGYAGVIETGENHMISSHTAKRFFSCFSIVRVWLFRKVLKSLFLWRLEKEQPSLIKIGIDTMVLDNNDADQREGVEPTYKKVKGFQPLQVYWGRYLIDAIFRNGKAHSNHGNHVSRVVSDIVRLIRSGYRSDVPIIILADTGFFDEKLLHQCERLNIGLIMGGKIYQDIKTYVEKLPKEQFSTYSKGLNSWGYCEFGNKRQSWSRYWRTIYAKPICEDDGQLIMEFARPETILYTNLGMENEITESLRALHDGEDTEVSPEGIISSYHLRARDELINRAIKDFGTEHLPFKKFTANTAFYYLMTISFFLFESFKYDMKSDTVPVTWYAGTFRRRILDVAGKLIRSGRQLILKITQTTHDVLAFAELWARSAGAEKIPIPLHW